MNLKHLDRLGQLKKGDTMKKILRVSPMIFLLVGYNGCIKASFKDLQMNLKISNANAARFNQSAKQSIVPDANNILTALGEDPSGFEEWENGTSVSSAMTYLNPLRFSILTSKASNEKNVTAIKEYYLKLAAGDYVKAFNQIDADIQALAAEALTKNSVNRPIFEKFVRFAKEARALIEIQKKDIEGATVGFKPTSGKLLSESLPEAEANLEASPDVQTKKVFQDLVRHLKAVKIEVDRLKKSHHGILKAIDAAKKELDIAQGLQRRYPNAPSHVQKVEILEDAIAQLNLENSQQNELDTKKQDDIRAVREKIAKNYESIDKDQNPAGRLAAAERDLIKLRSNLDSMTRYSGGYTARDLEEKQSEVALQQKVIETLRADQHKFDIEVSAKVQQMLALSNMDAKKVLDSLIAKYNTKTWSSFGSSLVGGSNQNAEIANITDSMDRAAAKQLQMQLAEAAHRAAAQQASIVPGMGGISSNYGAIANVGNDAANVMTSLNNVVNDTVAKAGSKIPPHKQPQVKAILERTRDTLLEIARVVPLEYQPEEKNKAMAAMSEELKTLLLVDFSGVNYAALQTRDALTIGVDYLMNKIGVGL